MRVNFLGKKEGGVALWDKTRWGWDIKSITFPRAKGWVKWASKRTSEHSGARKRSEQCGARKRTSEQTSEWLSTSVWIIDYSGPSWRGGRLRLRRQKIRLVCWSKNGCLMTEVKGNSILGWKSTRLRSLGRSAGWSVGRLVDRPVGRSGGWSGGQMVGRSDGWSIGR